MRTLLIAGTGGDAGHGILNLTAQFRDRIRIVGIASAADSPVNFRCDAVHFVPIGLDRKARTERLRDIVLAERPAVVLAGEDGELAALAELKDDPALAGTAFHTPGPRSAAVLTDRYAVSVFGRRLGLPFVETATTAAEVERMIARDGFPLVVRPRRGEGDPGVRVVRHPDEVAAWLARGDAAFQPAIGDPAAFETELVDPSRGVPLFVMARWHESIMASAGVEPGGAITYRGAIRAQALSRLTTRCSRMDDAAIEAVARAFAAAMAELDFAGFLTVSGRYDHAGKFVAYGAEGRVADSVWARTLLGVDDLAGVLAALLPDTPIAPAPLPPDRCHADRSLGWGLIPATDLTDLRDDGVWRRKAR